MSRIIAMWSGPRNLSTAMMRSFGARADCAVSDEPFFAPYLAVTGKAHPGREATLPAHPTDPVEVAAQCLAPVAQTYAFQKHMPHHMIDAMPLDWAEGAKHFFLLRHPQRVIASYAKGRADFEVEDLGYAPQRRLWEAFGRPPVVTCSEILANPERALRALCRAIDIPFDPAMLSWKSGARETDGAWAPWWYGSVERSTGFGVPPAHMPEIDAAHTVALAACLADYTVMAEASLRV